MKKAVVLLSGGLDSATTLYLAKKQGFKCFCLIFDYGQRHKKEIESAKKIAKVASCPWQIIKIRFPWKGSSLLDSNIVIPKHSNIQTFKHSNKIPSTYISARNIIFLSFALSYAEVSQTAAIFIGANAQDYSGYPDCRPEFYRAFSQIIAKGTKSSIENKRIEIRTPLMHKTKVQIIKLGNRLGVPFELTWSCYCGGKHPCGKCDSCYFRTKGFREAGMIDPIIRRE